MQDALLIYHFLASMRYAGYFRIAASALRRLQAMGLKVRHGRAKLEQCPGHAGDCASRGADRSLLRGGKISERRRHFGHTGQWVRALARLENYVASVR